MNPLFIYFLGATVSGIGALYYWFSSEEPIGTIILVVIALANMWQSNRLKWARMRK